MTNIGNHIRDLIPSDKLEKALDALGVHLKDKDAGLWNEITAHQATLQRLKKQSRRGLISSEEEDLTRTRVRFAMLEDLLPALETPADETATPAAEQDAQPATPAKRVFLSYNHGDNEIATKLKGALQAHDLSVTIDHAMRAGQGIQDFILESIRNTDVTLSLVSNKSLLSAWVALESVNTFYHAQFDDAKQFIACYIDDDFFHPRYRLDATDAIDARIQEIDELLPAYIERKLDTVDLNDEKSRLYKLRNTLGDILRQLKESLCLDVREDHFDESIARIVSAIKGS